MEALAIKEKRVTELERQSNTTAIEASSLKLIVGESKEFKILDIQAFQRVRTRFNRLKNETGMCFLTTMNGNYITVTRIEDEVTR